MRAEVHAQELCIRWLSLGLASRPGCACMQVPLMYATGWLKKRLKNDQVGNLIFWVTFCIVGQPTSLILYYHDWIILNRPGWLPEAMSQPDPFCLP